MSHVMLRHLRAADVPNDGTSIRVVREWDCEGFEVQWHRGRVYIVRNRTCLLGGMRIVRDTEGVRELINRTA